VKQRWLPGFDGPEVDEAMPADAHGLDVSIDGADNGILVLPGQVALFTVERELIGLMESAIADGRFEQALEFRDALVAREGPSKDTRELGLLDQLGAPAFWTRSLDACLDDWLRLDRAWAGAHAQHVLLRDGVFVRLLITHEPDDIVRAAPSLLAPLVNFLARVVGWDGTTPECLLRDTLLAGIAPPPGEFDDPAFVDLLAEDRAPQWLACLGALRRLWAVPPASGSELALPLPPFPEADGERGLQFWRCLRRAVSGSRDDLSAVEARKLMKLLDGDLHAEFMRHGVRRD
jgi:hypothetical protein